MTLDPFAAPVEEAQQPEPTTDPWGPSLTAAGQAAISVDVKPNILPADSGKLVTTFKAGSGYDAPWVVIHASSVDESAALLDQKFADYLGQVKKVAEFFSGGSKSSAGGGNTGARSNVPQGATDAPAWAPAKPFDDFVYKTGVSKKNGKVWHAWMPPEQGDSRDAKFFYPN